MAQPGLIRFRLTSREARDILRSPAVRADLYARALRVKAAAESSPQMVALEGPYPALAVDSDVSSGRAGATVVGIPLPLERSRRILGAAMDAAR